MNKGFNSNNIDKLKQIDKDATQKLYSKKIKRLFYVDTFFKVVLWYAVAITYICMYIVSAEKFISAIKSFLIYDVKINRINARLALLVLDSRTTWFIIVLLLILYFISFVSFKKNKKIKYDYYKDFRIKVKHPKKYYYIFMIFFVLLWIAPLVLSIAYIMYSYYISYAIDLMVYLILWKLVKILFIPHMIIGITLIYYFSSDAYYAQRQNNQLGTAFVRIV